MIGCKASPIASELQWLMNLSSSSRIAVYSLFKIYTRRLPPKKMKIVRNTPLANTYHKTSLQGIVPHTVVLICSGLKVVFFLIPELTPLERSTKGTNIPNILPWNKRTREIANRIQELTPPRINLGLSSASS
jgi:hypothetical protein